MLDEKRKLAHDLCIKAANMLYSLLEDSIQPGTVLFYIL